MILTGKCLQDFNKWSNSMSFGYVDTEPRYLDVNFDDLNSNIKNQIIIMWFNSVMYTIDRDSYNRKMVITDWTDGKEFQYTIECDYFDPFDEWYEQAIIKVNEIYNETNK